MTRRQRSRVYTVADFVLFQVCWFACAYTGPLGLWWLGPLAASLFIAWSCWRGTPARVLRLALGGAVLGLLLDGLMVWMGALSFPAPRQETIGTGMPVPLWMIGLWAAFGTLMDGPFRWLQGRYVLGATFGALGGPLSYLAGARLGGLQLGESPAQSLVLIGVE